MEIVSEVKTRLVSQFFGAVTVTACRTEVQEQMLPLTALTFGWRGYCGNRRRGDCLQKVMLLAAHDLLVFLYVHASSLTPTVE